VQRVIIGKSGKNRRKSKKIRPLVRPYKAWVFRGRYPSA
jgi:hypothetical protein